MTRSFEAEVIAEICKRAPCPPAPHGPGDDAAIRGERVVTSDLMVEGIHFLRAHPPAWLGHKLLAVNLSDVGAMAACPDEIVLSVALPKDTPLAWWRSFSEGLGRLAERAGVSLIGGDVTGSPGPIALNVTAWGALGPSGALLRSGGEPGDLLMLHTLQGVGRSSCGLEAWRKIASDTWAEGPPDTPSTCLLAHLAPETSWTMGPWAIDQGAKAGMDCSDGLFADVPRLADASGVRVRVELGGLPQDPACGGMSLEARAAGGEDYGLLVFVPREARARFESADFVVLGCAEEGGGVDWRINGAPLTSVAPGFDHFDGF